MAGLIDWMGSRMRMIRPVSVTVPLAVGMGVMHVGISLHKLFYCHLFSYLYCTVNW